ncbi:helix-turn-helix transcriptional regulator [Chloroflexia bacterium SDU3-3]|nr:helix-turn-helix transcriptional regulator [Chloroflexia bacterium SDU3-3]
MAVQNRVREMRTHRGMTQQALAEATRVTRQTIIAVEQGKFVPSVKLALELAAALHTPIGELFWLANHTGEDHD